MHLLKAINYFGGLVTSIEPGAFRRSATGKKTICQSSDKNNARLKASDYITNGQSCRVEILKIQLNNVEGHYRLQYGFNGFEPVFTDLVRHNGDRIVRRTFKDKHIIVPNGKLLGFRFVADNKNEDASVVVHYRMVPEFTRDIQ